MRNTTEEKMVVVCLYCLCNNATLVGCGKSREGGDIIY